ncbi:MULTISPECIES: acyl-CoA thioesterase [Chryseobacterium]|uniref:acyl-CoA thioesterase n=1 Tax=Chryseobacterium TaxID=59732 RepID=UPI000C9E0E45|nr:MULTISPECIES: thioesterase family protein [Chryseobacterium]MBM7419606.1 acyl-CoA thioester hydrolase [Chryseobacterium sp. JUb44]MDH6209537.1 acyl-CoA thioester hydrolase [Chryseobacterium sp. BIGb0186]WSO08300.1 thioesterase family protein [Chryseobacterium scophthalmum]VXB21683.1 Acyl-CoA thioester hydrolase [Chryseobacterium sp. 8AT]
MIHSKHSLRVRYAETDPMKYVYYGNYATYFELGRVELFRSIGISYDEIEKQGIWLPVSDYKIKYLKPALYDQKLEIHTFMKKIPGVRIEFEYEIYNEEGIKITEASTTLFFLNSETQKVIKCPDFLMKLIEENWKEEND